MKRFLIFQYAQAAIRHGASTYLLKPVNIEELAAAVQRVGSHSNEQKAERRQLHILRREMSAIHKQFWLDLFYGRIADPETTQDKYDWLDIPVKQAQKPILAVIVSVPDPSSIAATQSEISVTEIERQICIALESHSIEAIATVSSAPGEWTLVLRSARETVEWIPAMYAFGYALIAGSKAASLQLAAGFRKASNPYNGIHAAYGKAREAALKSISGLGGVLVDSDDGHSGLRREVRDALAFIRLHYAESITADLVAEAVFVSPNHLMHLFRKDLNKTFYECLTEYRIEEAKRLLRHSAYRVYEVGIKVGFNDSKYFSQIFRKMTGVSPTEYAKSYE